MNAAAKIASSYLQGFRSMKTERTLWLIIIFGFLKVAFYPGLLNSKFNSDAQRAASMLENITAPADIKNKVGRP